MFDLADSPDALPDECVNHNTMEPLFFYIYMCIFIVNNGLSICSAIGNEKKEFTVNGPDGNS